MSSCPPCAGAALCAVMVRATLNSLRLSRLEKERLLAALLISLGLHVAGWGGYAAGKKFHWWQRDKHSAQFQVANKKNPAQTVQEPEIFVEVSHAEAEPPKQTKFYSNKNSVAANPEADKNTDQPKLNGKQKDIPKTEDVPRLPQLQPSAPPPALRPAEQTPPDETPQPAGDLDPLKPVKKPEPQTQSQPQRPRTLKQARTDQNPGLQLQQDGGVQRQRVWSSLDAKATAFGDYDRKIVDAVTDHWYALLDSKNFAQDRTGKVILRFKLKFDGTVQDMETLENTVGELLGYVCQESIQDAAPFEKWPADMRRMIGANEREITFTFYYY